MLTTGYRGTAAPQVPAKVPETIEKAAKMQQHTSDDYLRMAAEIMDQGGGTLTVIAHKLNIPTISARLRAQAARAGYITRVKRADPLIFEYLPAPTSERGRPRRRERGELEQIKPGHSIAFDLSEISIDHLRSLIQSVRRATGNEFVTETDKIANTLTVTRVDSLDDAPEQLRAIAISLLGRRERWPFQRMQPGQTIAVIGGAKDVEAARAAAAYHKRKSGAVFRVNKEGADVLIARIS